MEKEWKGVTVLTKANIYFEGKVISRTVLFPDGSRKTLGIILPGEYEFSVGDREEMEIVSGSVEVLLPGTNSWKSFQAGDSFSLPKNSRYRIRSGEVAEYICGFLLD